MKDNQAPVKHRLSSAAAAFQTQGSKVMLSNFSSVSANEIAAKDLASFIGNERLGLDGAKDQFDRLRTINVFNLGDENARLDAGQVGAIVLELAREGGNRPLADKILERLAANQNWQAQKIDLEDLRSAVADAKKANAFGQTPADANAFQNLAFELGLSDAGSIVYDGELTHQKAAEILAERIAQKEGDPRVATLFKREVFDQALVREEPLTDWNAKAIKDSIEVAKTKVTSSSDLLSEKVQRFGKEILERDLNQWVKDAPVGENRAEAADRIVLCLEQKSGGLDLSDLGLTSLPKMAGLLTHLHTLDLCGNQLRSLPDWVGSLIQLQELNVSYNQLESLPELIGELKNLHQLKLDDNSLQSLPESIGSLIQLQELSVSHNQLQSLPESIRLLLELRDLYAHSNRLTSLPNEIGSLHHLETLSVSNNQLSSLPDSLISLPRSCNVRLNNNPLSQAALNLLREQFAQANGNGPIIHFNVARPPAAKDRSFDDIIGDWYKDGPKESDFDGVKESWQKLQDEPYANSFGKLLTKLQETPDYQNIQIRPLLKQRVITILERVLEDQELRGHCFSLAEEALTSCHDNVSLGLNNLEMAVIARRAGKGEFNEEQLLQLGRGMFRMEVLRLIAQNKMDSLRTVDNVDDVDDVEVILAYQVGLRESLDLPVQTQEMLFRRISGVTDEDLATARELVLAAEQGKELPEFLAKENLVLLEFLAGWSPWQQQLEREYSSRFEGIIERFSDRESELGRRVKSQEIDEGAYVQELNQMPKELEQSRLALCKELTKEKLAGGL